MDATQIVKEATDLALSDLEGSSEAELAEEGLTRADAERIAAEVRARIADCPDLLPYAEGQGLHRVRELVSVVITDVAGLEQGMGIGLTTQARHLGLIGPPAPGPR